MNVTNSGATASNVCLACGTSNQATAAFCTGCGKSLADKCQSCGVALKPGARFCESCGQPVQAQSMVITPVQAAVPVAAPAVAVVPQQVPGNYPPAQGAIPVFGTRYAGFWIRFVAYMIDSIIVTVIVFGLLRVTEAVLVQCPAGAAVVIGCPGGLTFLQPQFWLIIALAVLYSPVMWGTGGTLGQRLLRLRVVGVASGVRIGMRRGFLRLLGYILASIPIYLGVFWIGWDRRKQGWHDKIAGSVVVHRVKP